MKSRGEIFIAVLLAFVAGIFVDSFFAFPIGFVVFLAAFVAIPLNIVKPYAPWIVVAVLLLSFTAGVARHNTSFLQTQSYELAEAGESVEFIGRIVREPEVGEKSMLFVVEKEDFGKVQVTTDRFAQYQYGDVVQLKGELEEPIAFEDFDYKGFLARKGIWAVMYKPEIQLLAQGKYGSLGMVYNSILDTKDHFRSVINNYIPAPESSILAAMLLGDKGRLSETTKEKLNKAGVRHITAISGMHVAILGSLAMSFLLGVRTKRKNALIATIIFLVLFVVLTGLQASAVRAVIMGGLVLIGQYAGRQNVSLRGLAIAAAIMLAFNPLLTVDAGFQLSFLAVLGIILLFPLLQDILYKIPSNFGLRDVMVITIAAQAFTLPVMMHTFGMISIVSPLTNLLLVPVLPFVLATGVVFIASASVLGVFGTILSVPLFILLHYLVVVVELISELPFAAIAIGEVRIWWLLLPYIPFAFIIWKVRKKYDDPFSL